MNSNGQRTEAATTGSSRNEQKQTAKVSTNFSPVFSEENMRETVQENVALSYLAKFIDTS